MEINIILCESGCGIFDLRLSFISLRFKWKLKENNKRSITELVLILFMRALARIEEMTTVTYIGSASPLIADIKTEPYSVITYSEYGTLTGTYDNTHEIPIYVDNGTTLNIMLTHFYEKAYYLHHLPKEVDTINTIHTGNGPIQTRFWIDILLNIQGCMLQFKLLVCDTKAQTGILLSKMALEQLQTWQDYSTNSLYIKQTAIDLYATQDVELFP